MDPRLTRWGVASVLGFAGLLAATLPPGPSALELLPNYYEDPGYEPIDRAWRSTVDALYLAKWRLAEAEDRATLRRMSAPRRSPLVVRLARGGVQVDEAMTRRAEALWRSAEVPAGARPALLVVPSVSGRDGGDWIDATSWGCTVRLAPATSSGWRRDTIAASAGRCLLEAKFGTPGPQVKAWVDSVYHIAIPRGSLATSRPPSIAAGASQGPELFAQEGVGLHYWGGLMHSRETLACAAGRIEFCQAAVRLPAWTSDVSRRRYVSRVLPGHLPAALLAELGPERFGELWRSEASIPESYERLTGAPFDPWAMEFVQRRTGRVERPTALSLGEWVGWLFWMGVLTGWGIVRLKQARAR